MVPSSAVCVAVCLLWSSSSLGAQTPPPKPAPVPPPATTRPDDPGGAVDAVVAKVYNLVITKSMVEKELGPNLNKLPPEQRARQFNVKTAQLVEKAIADEAVRRTGMSIPKRFILQRIEAEKERLGGEAEFQASLRERGVANEEEYTQTLGRDLTRQTYTAAQAGEFANRAPQFRPEFWVDPTAEEIRHYYQQHLKDKFTQKDQARVSAIFLPLTAFRPPGKDAVDQATLERLTLEKCDEVREGLRTGADFAVIARRYSRGPKADEGGELGWIDGASAYQKEVIDYGLTGPLNELSPPIPYPSKVNPRGYVLVLVKERVQARVMPFSEAQQVIRETLRNENVDTAKRKVFLKLLNEAYIWPAEIKRQLIAAYSK